MNKRPGGKQIFLRDSWYFQDRLQITQKTYTENSDRTQCQKSIQKVLKERNFWLIKRFKLTCLSLKYLDYQTVAEYKLCVKRIRCESCKNPKEHRGITECTLQQKCDAYILCQIQY